MDAVKALNRHAFLSFVTSVLRQIAALHNQDIYFKSKVPADLYVAKSSFDDVFSAVAPNGFGEIEKPVIFEFKYTQQVITQGMIDSLRKRVMSSIFIDVAVVLLTNSDYDLNISFTSKKELNISQSGQIDFEIWGHNIIKKWISQYPIDYHNAQDFVSYLPEAEPTQRISENDFISKSENNLASIKQIIKSSNNFAFVLGAGVSIDPGAKSWDQLLAYFTEELKKRNMIKDDMALKEKVGGSSIITAQLCKELYPKEVDYYWAIHQGLYAECKEINQDYALHCVAEISKRCANKSHFRILTYNYDNYLESYLDSIGVSTNSLFDSHSDINDRLSIYHVHGYMPKAKFKTHVPVEHQKSIYLTEEDYNRLYNHPYSWQISSQLSFFRENICLFVGCSLADPNIRRLLEMTQKEGRIHYVILTKGNMSIPDLIAASNHFHRIGIEVIWINSHKDLPHRLRSLLN